MGGMNKRAANPTWDRIDAVAAEIGATPAQRKKWRQRNRVPAEWRIRIYEEAKGAIRLDEFPHANRLQQAAE